MGKRVYFMWINYQILIGDSSDEDDIWGFEYTNRMRDLSDIIEIIDGFFKCGSIYGLI